MQARSIDISVPTVLAHMRQMRVQFTNMARRRADFLRRFAADDINASTVEDFMHEHRDAFNNSEGQRFAQLPESTPHDFGPPWAVAACGAGDHASRLSRQTCF